MTEIELKAHVYNRQELIKTLNSFAKFLGTVTKDDEYFGTCKNDKHKIRIRRELKTNVQAVCNEQNCNTQKEIFFVTYKKKELIKSPNGSCVEVNDEKECTVSNPDALKSFLLDTGYCITLKKHKEVSSWQVELVAGSVLSFALTATLELCTVPPLGDFLEIEILSPVNDKDSVCKVQKELETLLTKAGISKDCIEPRYYSQMLHDVTK